MELSIVYCEFSHATTYFLNCFRILQFTISMHMCVFVLERRVYSSILSVFMVVEFVAIYQAHKNFFRTKVPNLSAVLNMICRFIY